MTLTQFDVTSLLDAIRAGGDIDIIRKGRGARAAGPSADHG